MIRTIAWNITLVLLGVALGWATFEPCETCVPCEPCDTVVEAAKDIEFLSDEVWHKNQRLIKQLEIEQNDRYGI